MTRFGEVRLWAIGATVLLVFAGMLGTAPAAAQSGNFICPNGPGPGERQVGVQPNGVPVCTSTGPSGPAPAPVQMRAVDSYYATAWHAESNDGWIASGYLNKDRAIQAALAACNRAMGGGCTLASSNVNGTVALARGSYGDLYLSDRGKRGDAEKAVKEQCAKLNDECEILRTVSANPGRAAVGARLADNPEIFAPNGDGRRSFGAMVWLDGSKLAGGPWVDDIWVVGGRPSAAKAEADALAACRADLRGPGANACSVAIVASDVYVAVSSRDGTSSSLKARANAALAQKRVMEHCGKTKGKCMLAATLYLGTEQITRFSPSAQGKPYFTAQAWTKSNTAPWQNSVWSVSGVKDEAMAKAAALAACRKESGQDCELSSHSFNSKVAFYIDQTGYIRLSWLHQSDDPAAYVANTCTEKKLTCKLVKVVDARVPGTERIEVK